MKQELVLAQTNRTAHKATERIDAIFPFMVLFRVVFFIIIPSRDVFADSLQMYCNVTLSGKKGFMRETTESTPKCIVPPK